MKSVKFILGAQYFLYFGILGLFLPFFNLYCYHLGFSGFEIGVLSSAKTLTTALFPMIWAAFADRFHIRRPIYIFCNFASTAFWALFLLTTDFWLMLAITAFYGFLRAYHLFSGIIFHGSSGKRKNPVRQATGLGIIEFRHGGGNYRTYY
ncbi:MAG: MFS transporter [Desulfobacterales bacterium]